MTSDGVVPKFMRDLALRKEAEAADADRQRKSQIKNANQLYDFELQRIDGKLEAKDPSICALKNLTVLNFCTPYPRQPNLKKTLMNAVVVKQTIYLECRREITRKWLSMLICHITQKQPI